MTITKRLIEPLFIKVDFTDSFWDISTNQARVWLVAAVVTDLLVQSLAGSPNLLTIIASFLTLAIFWAIPARLSGAVGGLYIGQALGSLVVVTATAMTGYPMAVDVVALLWWAWCMFALVQLILGYIRTPNKVSARCRLKNTCGYHLGLD